jgi:hypothetical protein
MTGDESRARYLESGTDAASVDASRLDLIRSVLGDEATWTEPPPEVLDGVLAALSAERPQTPHGAAPVEGARWPLWIAVIGSVAALIALILATVSVVDRAGETVVAMSGTELESAAWGAAAVRPTGSGWWIRLDLVDLPPAPDGHYYEGWVWSDDGDGVSIGTFHLREGSESVVLWSGVELADYPSIWVTLEPEDGGPETSDQVVMTGRVPGIDGA